MDDASARAACLRFEREQRRRVADEVGVLSFGDLIMTPSLAPVHDLNLATVHAEASFDPAEVMATTIRELTARRTHATHVYVEGERACAELSPAMLAAGWDRTDYVFQRLHGNGQGDRPDRPDGQEHRDRPDLPDWPATAHVLDDEQACALRRTLTRARPWCDSEDIVESFVEYQRRSLMAGNGRMVGILDADGAPIAGAWVLTADLPGVGVVRQIEEVEVVEAHKGTGVGRVLMEAATHAAMEGDPALVFLSADAADWPRRWYERLGFEVIGRAGHFNLARL